MIIFLHGVPETAAIWDKVRNAIGRESVALQLPGFGCARPEAFAATKDDYIGWLLGELDQIDGPIDLVGHDWGAAFVYRIATAYGDKVRSWVADVGNIAHPDYVWHGIAQIWQSPGEGEAFVDAQNSAPTDERAGGFESMGVPHDDAMEMAAASDATMGACILALYRSALPNAHADWGPWSPTRAPGLVLHPTEDAFSEEKMGAEVAESLGARFERLEGAGHFWPYQAPEQAAAIFESFWASVA